MPKPQKKPVFLILALLAIAITGYFLFAKKTTVSTDDAAIESNIVAISPKIPGYVKVLNVQDNQEVKKGDVIFEIDSIDYELALSSALSSLDAAKARLAASSSGLETAKVSAPSNVASARAQLASAQANYENAKADLKRYRELEKGAVSKQQLDAAIATEKAAASSVADAEAKLKTAQTAPNTIEQAKSGVKELEAMVAQNESQVATAEENLRNTKVVAPFDGRITKRGVEQGAYVQAGQQMMALVSDDYWVVANFKETQLEKMRPGQPVEIKIDAYPGKSYKGKVDSIQTGTGARFSAFPPENATGNFVKIVQRVPVKILFTERPEKSMPIGPGMSVIPTVDVK